MPSPRSILHFIFGIIAVGLIIGGIYWGINATYFTSGTNSNGIAVAASAAYGSLFLVGAILIIVVIGFQLLVSHMARVASNAEEQTRLLKYIAKQSQPRQ